MFHSGFVAIIGRPNAGKSTLVNKLVGRKVAIVSPRPQTTHEVTQAVDGVDIVSLIVDATEDFQAADRHSVEWVKRFSGPAYLLLNKVDRSRKDRLLPLIDRWRGEHDFEEIFPISALTGEGTLELVESWIARLPEHP